MIQSEKFLFDANFDNDTAKRGGPAKKEKPPTFTEDDLAAAEQRGFDAGHGKGLQEAKQSAEERIAVCLEALAGRLGELGAQAARTQERQQRDTLEIARQALGKLFPALALQGALEEAERVIESCLTRLRSEPRIVLRTADGLHDLLRDHVEEVANRAGFEGRIVLLTEEEMGPSDIRIEWADGGAERDTTGLWAEIDEIVARSLGGVETGPEPASRTASAQDLEQAPQPEVSEPESHDPAKTDPDLGRVEPSV